MPGLNEREGYPPGRRPLRTQPNIHDFGSAIGLFSLSARMPLMLRMVDHTSDHNKISTPIPTMQFYTVFWGNHPSLLGHGEIRC